MSKTQKRLTGCFAAIGTLMLLLCFVIAGTATVSAKAAADARADKTLKVTFTVPEGIRSDSFKIGIDLFGWMGTAKTGAIADNSTFVYEVYSPTPVSGLGSLSPWHDDGAAENKEWKSWEYKYPSGKTDTFGNSALSSADLSKAIGNGWYERKIPLGDIAKNEGLAKIQAVLDTTEDVAGGGTLSVYFKNAKILAPDGTVQAYLFFDAADGKGGTTALPITGTGDWIPFQDANTPYKDDVSFSAAYVDKPTLSPLSLKEKGDFAEGQEIDLESIVNLNGNTLSSVSVTRNDTIVDAPNNKFTPSAGEYTLRYKAAPQSGEFSYDFYTEITVINEELTLAANPLKDFPKEYTADTDSIRFPIVLGKVDGVSAEAQIHIVDAAGIAVAPETVIKESDAFLFAVPEAGKYAVTYSLAKGDKTVTTTPAVITVGAINYSVADSLPAGTAATAYSLSSLWETAVPPVAVESVEVRNPFGRKVTLTSAHTFTPSEAGKYKVKIAVGDSRFGSAAKEYSTGFTIAETDGMPLKISVAVPAAHCGEGVQKQVVLRLFEKNQVPKLAEGDVFRYELFMPSPMSGVGLVSFMGDGGKEANGGEDGDWGYFGTWDNWNADGESKDKAGLNLEGTADLSAKLKDSAQKPVWYAREIAVPASWQKPVFDATFEIKTTDAVAVLPGEDFGYIEAYVRNAKITKADGSVIPLFSDTVRPKPIPQIPNNMQYLGDDANSYWSDDWVDPAVSVAYALSPTPVFNGSVLPDDRMISCGDAFTIPGGVLYSYADFAAAQISGITVCDSVGNEYTVSNNAFTPKRTGEYTVTVDGTDKEGLYGKCVFSLYADAVVINETTRNGYKDLSSALDDLTADGNVLYIRGGEYTQNLAPSYAVTLYTDETTPAVFKGKFTSKVTFGANVSAYGFTVTVTGGTYGGSPVYGEKITLTPDAAPEGKVFAGWQVNGRAIEGNEFTMPAENVTVTALYRDEQKPIEKKGCNSSVSGGETFLLAAGCLLLAVLAVFVKKWKRIKK